MLYALLHARADVNLKNKVNFAFCWDNLLGILPMNFSVFLVVLCAKMLCFILLIDCCRLVEQPFIMQLVTLTRNWWMCCCGLGLLWTYKMRRVKIDVLVLCVSSHPAMHCFFFDDWSYAHVLSVVRCNINWRDHTGRIFKKFCDQYDATTLLSYWLLIFICWFL